MRKIMTGCLLLLLAGGVQAESPPKRVGPETFKGTSVAVKKAASVLRLQPPLIARRAASAKSLSTGPTGNEVVLPALNMQEIQQLQEDAGRQKAFHVGIGREMPESFRGQLDLNKWPWVDNGEGQLAHFTLTSTDATRVRAQIVLQQMPPGVELRVYSPMDPSTVFGPYTEAATFWTPTLQGDALGLELYLPAGISPDEVSLAIPQLSHLVVNPAESRLKSSLFKEAEYASCQQDLACAAPEWQETGNSVARYVFTDSGGQSYLCSGTLLSDTDTATQIPYFFTAAHCVDSPASAASMDFFWLYQNSACGGGTTDFTQTAGGAELLASRPELDTSLVMLNNAPPAGVNMAGWTLEPLTPGQEVTGIHHALGYPKKYAQGNFQGTVKITTSSSGYAVVPDPNGDFSQVVWHTGITAPGSSGSGIWVEDNGVHYLNGSLLGGSSDCTNTTAPDEYSRFERTWPYVSKWLDTDVPPPSLYLRGEQQVPTALVEGVIIARYIQGERGSSLLQGVTAQSLDTAELETSLMRLLAVMDIDDDGDVDAGVDASLLTRYLLGLRGAPLTQGLDLTQAERPDAAAIAAYIESLLSAGK